MAGRLTRLFQWLISRAPEMLLIFFFVSLMPGALLVALEVKTQVGRLFMGPAVYVKAAAEDPWTAAAAAACVVGVPLLAFILWRNWQVVWAVARKLIAEALHRRVVVLVLVFFAVTMCSLPFILETEGSLVSRVQIVLSYALALGMVLLSLLAIFLSVASICSEIDRKQIHITDTKPVRRWQFLLGKWFGVVVLCTSVLFAMAMVVYVLLGMVITEPDVSRMVRLEAEKASEDYRKLSNEVLVARRTVRASLPADLDGMVEKAWESRKAEDGISPSLFTQRRLRKEMRKDVLGEAVTVVSGRRLDFHFEGLRPGTDRELVQVRFNAHASVPGTNVYGRWFSVRRVIGTDDEGKPTVSYEGGYPVYPPPDGWASGVVRQFELPASVISEDGSLILVYENRNNDQAAIIFDPEYRVQVLQRDSGFVPNYYRALMVLLCHVALLAALGLAAGSIFSFPVASLVVVTITTVGLVGAWFVNFLEPVGAVQYSLGYEILWLAWAGFIRVLLSVLPHFGSYNPIGNLADGTMVTWAQVSYAGAALVFLKGAGALLIGMYFYARRELARIIV
jgi:hypothetical protein